LDPRDPKEGPIRKEFYAISTAMRVSTEPFDVPFQPVLTALLGNATACPRQPIHVANGNATSIGSDCSIRLMFKQPQMDGVTEARVTLPSTIRGTFKQQIKISADIVFDKDPLETPKIEWFKNGKSIGVEPLQRISVTTTWVKFTGALRYCLWLQIG